MNNRKTIKIKKRKCRKNKHTQKYYVLMYTTKAASTLIMMHFVHFSVNETCLFSYENRLVQMWPKFMYIHVYVIKEAKPLLGDSEGKAPLE